MNGCWFHTRLYLKKIEKYIFELNRASLEIVPDMLWFNWKRKQLCSNFKLILSFRVSLYS